MSNERLSSRYVWAEFQTEVYVPAELGFAVSNSEYAEAVRAKALENHLPIVTEFSQVEWDGSTAKQDRVVMRHTDPRLSALQFLAGLERFGDFYYVEEKLLSAPPTLPAAPTERRPTEPNEEWMSILWFFFGLLLFALGCWVLLSHDLLFDEALDLLCGGPMLLSGMGLFAVGLSQRSKERQKYEAEKNEYQATLAYDRAATEWVLQLNDAVEQFGRYQQGIRSTIAQVVDALFKDRHAEIRSLKQREMNRKEIEEELERRRSEGFK